MCLAKHTVRRFDLYTLSIVRLCQVRRVDCLLLLCMVLFRRRAKCSCGLAGEFATSLSASTLLFLRLSAVDVGFVSGYSTWICASFLGLSTEAPIGSHAAHAWSQPHCEMLGGGGCLILSLIINPQIVELSHPPHLLMSVSQWPPENL